MRTAHVAIFVLLFAFALAPATADLPAAVGQIGEAATGIGAGSKLDLVKIKLLMGCRSNQRKDAANRGPDPQRHARGSGGDPAPGTHLPRGPAHRDGS